MIDPPVALMRSVPSLGVAEGRCRPGEPGPAVVVTAVGLKDRKGRLRAEVYPDNDADFLADDNLLLAAGKTFRRTETDVPPEGAVQLCVRLPAPGTYALSLVHDRDGNRKFTALSDGIGFPGDPHLGWSKPRAAAARFVAGQGVTELRITLNYWRGLASFGPIKSARP